MLLLASGSHKVLWWWRWETSFSPESNISEKLQSKAFVLGSGFRQLAGQESKRLAPCVVACCHRLQSAACVCVGIEATSAPQTSQALWVQGQPLSSAFWAASSACCREESYSKAASRRTPRGGSCCPQCLERPWASSLLVGAASDHDLFSLLRNTPLTLVCELLMMRCGHWTLAVISILLAASRKYWSVFMS